MRIARAWPVALLAAFLAHNLEEALTYPLYREDVQDFVRANLAAGFTAPSPASFYLALIVVSGLATAAMGLAVVCPAKPISPLLVRGMAWIMLANVFLPHLPAAILLGGYVPGLVTALAINLPLALVALLATRENRQPAAFGKRSAE